ncbi:DoxX family protein [Pseudomonas taiwanensis]|uniref:DoxX family protein n=1 Tax=Pseudomonas taiwanensis TaxID=470150 RepID=UPI0028DF0618|nr:DoxX family protein [Pseudomonas taiwanensis]MDT8924523.1 DoxX family protein [Pseudomonas taiwanensis]
MSTTTIYWISTTLLSFIYIASAALYVVRHQWVKQSLQNLGYPDYLVTPLTAAKLLAVSAILTRVNVTLSELAYAGMFYHLLLSAAAHIGVRNTKGSLPALIGLVLLALSFFTQNDAQTPP